MSRILTDIEHGAVVFIHDLASPPTAGDTLPDEIVHTVATLAERLGLPAAGITPQQIGWLSDIVGHVVDTLSATTGGDGHANAGVEPPGVETAPPGGNTEATAPQATTAPQPAAADAEAVAPPATMGTPQTAASPATEAAVPPPDTTNLDAVIAKASQQYGAGGTPAA